MIIANIRGGLGNQFFTYATAYAFSKKINTEVILDTQIYDTFYQLRVCQLEQFRIVYRDRFMKKCPVRNKYAYKLYNLNRDRRIFKKLHAEAVYEKEEFALQSFPSDPSKNYFIQGYWQNYRYFHEYRADLAAQLTLLNTERIDSCAELQKILDKGAAAVHVRRGDYTTFKGGMCLSARYYKEAIDTVRNEGGQDTPLIVFTDDTEFCRKMFKDAENIYYIADLGTFSDIEEFEIMKRCRHFVLANSTFSWWAAYLANNENSIVTAPVLGMWTENFYLPEWRKIAAETDKEQ